MRHTLWLRGAKARRRVRDTGPRATAAFAARRLWQQLYLEEPLLVLSKDLGEIVVPLRRGQVRLEQLDQSRVAALRAFNEPRGRQTANDRLRDLADGYGGYLGLVGDELVACYWWADGRMAPHRDMRLFGLGIELGERDVYGFDLYVREDRRAGGTVSAFLCQVETALRDRGFDTLWGYVLADNRTARWVYDSRGYRARWRIDRRRILRCWRSRAVPLEQVQQRAS